MIQNNTVRLKLKDWAEEDRPREKLVSKGVTTLSNAELLAILIGSGNRDETVVELSQRILHSVANNLNTLGKLTLTDLCKFKGIGEAKAVTILAALELGRRRKMEELAVEPQINSSQDAYNIIHPILADIPHEEMWVLFLNRSNKVVKKFQASKGGVVGVVMDVRMIMKEALGTLATAMILCHNHPSGDAKPSAYDDTITLQLKEAGKIMDVQLLDHIIIAHSSYYSYGDNNRL